MSSEHRPAPYDGLIAALAEASAQPLWDRYQRITRPRPATPSASLHWPWARMEPLIQRAVDEVGMDDAERRVLLMTDPHLPQAATTGNLLAGLQTLMPGETAHAHRHTIAALRFMVAGQGAVTAVNRVPCPMEPGDLVLTPSWTWHEHVHNGAERVVWLDGLDLPLCAHLDTMFFEPGVADPLPMVEPQPTRPPVAKPLATELKPDPGHPFRYSASRARQMLEQAPRRADGSRWLRYVDGVSGGAVLPSVDCYLQQLPAGQRTLETRSTASAIALVVEGSGSSRVGDVEWRWSAHDVFTLPHWQWASHQADAGGATLFLMTDLELKAALGYLREEERESTA